MESFAESAHMFEVYMSVNLLVMDVNTQDLPMMEFSVFK